jgi:hypothetical protein
MIIEDLSGDGAGELHPAISTKPFSGSCGVGNQLIIFDQAQETTVNR